LTGTEANETNLKRNELSKYRYLVLATHGLLDNKISGIMEPALVLGQVGNKEGDDGFLTMSEIMDLRLNCSVAALTACETGSGKLVNGEGVMGLGRAFQYAGANSVLASLWSVAEDSTVTLVERFFYYLQSDKDKSTALRMARNDIRKIGYDHPFFWAPFILIGESR
jgi:CHAT domain-containing protein